ncbi:DUF6538 domain-containing protein [Lichenifustis flavocetrariae]|uniref:Tyrosine-type recombinase/integrase n=1 Tax=Lichenifustis flavocetrariae TaxID=2949735 RepID=A0AA41YZY6_9HYPH|nr:DUF6538 domain-containing protein [Lichenifustis flavocetrariae]MCW6510335.1 tyrosine-type recombinase/integrase [Lichenifustis flavocetrariae]
MARPIALGNGNYHLNIRVPADLAAKVKGTFVSLPIADRFTTVRISDKVIVSLRTKDPVDAKLRFGEAFQALMRHWAAVRSGPVPLTHKQIVALAGDIYRRWVEYYENDPALTPEWLQDGMAQLDVDAEALRSDLSDELGDLTPETAAWLARLSRPNGPELLAFELNQDIDRFGTSVRLDDALEHLFGPDVDAVCSQRALILDAGTRGLLVREVARAVRFAAQKLLRNIDGDYSPDPAAARFPAFSPPVSVVGVKPIQSARIETVGALFERWKLYAADKVAASTIRRYGPSLASLDRWSKGRDWRALTDDDIFAWAVNRRDADGIAPATINRNDLVAASSIFAWPMSMSGGKLSTSNPTAGIKLPLPKRVSTREKMFRRAEITAILRLARAVKPDPRHPRASASRRWCPWLCAYSGARIQETLWLKKQHIRREGDVWIMDLQQTKDGHARLVPLHEALIEEGFLQFVEAAPSGFLFVGDREQKESATRSAQELRAAELASWVRSKVELDKELSPNHAWRHSWITYAEAAGVPKRFSNRITGHNFSKDASDGYVAGLVSMLAVEMRKFPRYNID